MYTTYTKTSFVRKFWVGILSTLLVWTMSAPVFQNIVFAAQVSSFSDSVSTSAPGAQANHTFTFTTPSGVPADGSTIVIGLPSGFNVSTITSGDVDIADDGVELTVGASCGAVQAAVSVSSQNIIVQICSGGGGAIAATSVVSVQVGTHADGGTHQITNHATVGSYVITLGGTMTDSGDTRIVIVESVQVSASVETIFTFSVNGVDADVTVNNDTVPTSATSTATTVPFGIITPNTPKVVAQELRVDTNALNGFTVTVQADQTLESSTGASIDTFIDGTNVASSTLWTTPAGTMGNPSTYGHWGITSDDDVISGPASTHWGTGEAAYKGNFVSNPVEVFYHNGPTTSGAGTGVGSTRVAYKVATTNLQEAAKDYRAVLTYIATPVF